jgi:hypothetical protein
MIAAFGRAHYVRYDESSATRLTDIAGTVRDEYADDLRGLAGESDRDLTAALVRVSLDDDLRDKVQQAT